MDTVVVPAPTALPRMNLTLPRCSSLRAWCTRLAVDRPETTNGIRSWVIPPDTWPRVASPEATTTRAIRPGRATRAAGAAALAPCWPSSASMSAAGVIPATGEGPKARP